MHVLLVPIDWMFVIDLLTLYDSILHRSLSTSPNVSILSKSETIENSCGSHSRTVLRLVKEKVESASVKLSSLKPCSVSEQTKWKAHPSNAQNWMVRTSKHFFSSGFRNSGILWQMFLKKEKAPRALSHFSVASVSFFVSNSWTRSTIWNSEW